MKLVKDEMKIGVLAFHGDVAEHVAAVEAAARTLRVRAAVVLVHTKESLVGLDALILPGGESTTLHKLCVREDMWEDMKKIPHMFGTCAGAIMLAKTVEGKAEGQETLGCMDISISRNAYGRQADSFSEKMATTLGTLTAVFIRAPRILKVSPEVKILASRDGEIVACEERRSGCYYLAATFHPELSSPLFHIHFLKVVFEGSRVYNA